MKINAVRILVTFVIIFGGSRICAQQTAPAIDKTVALRRLTILGYWTDTGNVTTTYQNKQAIIAFQKISGLSRTGELNEKTMTLVWRAGTPNAKDSIHVKHIEVDLDHQILFVVDSSDKVERILSVSTGNGKRFFYPEKGWENARTPRGHFKVYYKISGWHKSELGLLYYPLYIYGGFAIHGSASVPAKPASHGCIRIPIFASEELFRSTPIGTPVVIYGQNPKSD